MQTRITTRIARILNFRLFAMGELLLLFDGGILIDQAGDGPAGNLQLHVIRFDAQNQHVGRDGDDGAYDASGGDYFAARLQPLQHLLLLLLLALHGHEHQKVKDGDDEDERKEAHHGVRGGRLLLENEREIRHPEHFLTGGFRWAGRLRNTLARGFQEFGELPNQYSLPDLPHDVKVPAQVMEGRKY